jgi:hypothetical protein
VERQSHFSGIGLRSFNNVGEDVVDYLLRI